MERGKVIEAILTIATALLAIFAYIVWKSDVYHYVLVYIALGLMLMSLLSKWLSAKFVWLWFKLGEGMGYIMSKVILGVVFFFFLFPISVLYRMFNKDALQLRRKDDTTYTDRSHTYTASDLENPW